MLKENDKAPINIKATDLSGKETSLADHSGQYVVIFFYPKDNTPGCTLEACSFRDMYGEITKLGAKVIGVSRDSTKSHEGFIKRHKLNYDLWSDEDLKLHQAFGCWVEKSMFGKKYMGAQRSTFIISPDGVIVKVWEKASTTKNAEEVYGWLKENAA